MRLGRWFGIEATHGHAGTGPDTQRAGVTYADTGKPVPHAPLEVMTSRGRAGQLADFETDADGRARVNSWPADGIYNVWAFPPQGQPHLIDQKRLLWPKAALEQSVDLVLPRGYRFTARLPRKGPASPSQAQQSTFPLERCQAMRKAEGSAAVPRPMDRSSSAPCRPRVTYS